jgi:heme A synthase
LLPIVALLAWFPDRRTRSVWIAIPILLFIQGILGGTGRWGGAFHPLNAFLILALLGWLTHRLWRGRGDGRGDGVGSGRLRISRHVCARKDI